MCFFFQAEDGIRDIGVTGVQTCALPIYEADQLAPSEGLGQPPALEARQVLADAVHLVDGRAGGVQQAGDGLLVFEADRSEERRVGKECRCRGSAYQSEINERVKCGTPCE